MPKRSSFNPSRIYLHLDPSGDAHRLDTSEKGFWSSLGDRHIDGRLVGLARMSRNSAWEMHPDGDEVLFVLSGSMDVVLDDRAGEQVVNIAAGRMCVVPRGVWHRQIVSEPCDLLFATPGPATEHRGVREHKALRERDQTSS